MDARLLSFLKNAKPQDIINEITVDSSVIGGAQHNLKFFFEGREVGGAIITRIKEDTFKWIEFHPYGGDSSDLEGGRGYGSYCHYLSLIEIAENYGDMSNFLITHGGYFEVSGKRKKMLEKIGTPAHNFFYVSIKYKFNSYLKTAENYLKRKKFKL